MADTRTADRTHIRVVGELACQRESHRAELESVVVSCAPMSAPALPEGSSAVSDGKKNKKRSVKSVAAEGEAASADHPSALRMWEVECEDSILFPEGGGQYTDYGTLTIISDVPSSPTPIPITRIERRGLRALIFSPVQLARGTRVLQHIDARRRKDHMQQHTAQHLLSAVMERGSGSGVGSSISWPPIETLGWSMGQSVVSDRDALQDDFEDPLPNMSFVELPIKPSPPQIRAIQARCNDLVAANLTITVKTPLDAATGSLPKDYDVSQGVVRVIVIDGVDENPCCGTHLSSTAQIGPILLHHTAPIRGTNTRLYFTAGDRALALANAGVRMSRSVSALMSVPALGTASTTSATGAGAVVGVGEKELENKVAQLLKDAKDSRAARRKLEAEIAAFEAERVARENAAVRTTSVNSPNIPLGAFVHRATEDGTDYITAITAALKRIVSSGADEKAWLDDAGLPLPGFSLVILITPLPPPPGTVSSTLASESSAVVVLGAWEPAVRAITQAIDALPSASKDGSPPKMSIRGGGRGTKWQGKITGPRRIGERDVAALRAAIAGGVQESPVA